MNGHSDAVDMQVAEAIDREKAEADAFYDYYRQPIRGKAFMDYIEGKLTRDEWHRIDEKYESIETAKG